MLPAPHCGCMYTITASAAAGSEQIWTALLSLRQLQAAEDAVRAAGVRTAQLAVQSQWHNDGLSPRALRAALDELHSSIMGALSDVRLAESEVERAMNA